MNFWTNQIIPNCTTMLQRFRTNCYQSWFLWLELVIATKILEQCCCIQSCWILFWKWIDKKWIKKELIQRPKYIWTEYWYASVMEHTKKTTFLVVDNAQEFINYKDPTNFYQSKLSRRSLVRIPPDAMTFWILLWILF